MWLGMNSGCPKNVHNQLINMYSKRWATNEFRTSSMSIDTSFTKDSSSSILKLPSQYKVGLVKSCLRTIWLKFESFTLDFKYSQLFYLNDFNSALFVDCIIMKCWLWMFVIFSLSFFRLSLSVPAFLFCLWYLKIFLCSSLKRCNYRSFKHFYLQ